MLITSSHDYKNVFLDVTPDDDDNPEFKNDKLKIEVVVAKGGYLTIRTSQDFPDFKVQVPSSMVKSGEKELRDGDVSNPVTLAVLPDGPKSFRLNVCYHGKPGHPPREIECYVFPCGPCPRGHG